MAMTLIDYAHERYVKGRRVRVLADTLAEFLPADASVLDVGCGDGSLAADIGTRRRDLTITGLDVLVRPDVRIPVQSFDGVTLPLESGAVDIAMFVDVLHHTHHAEQLLREACRVARKAILIKDHSADGLFARPVLRRMDRVGNARFGVALPHLYLTWGEWLSMFGRLGLHVGQVRRRLHLYPAPLTWICDRSLHFVTLLTRA